MTIHFIPNDPLPPGQLPPRKITPRPNRPAARAGFVFHGREPEREYDVGTSGFVYWQAREAALASVDMWEAIHGPFRAWEGGRTIALVPDQGVDLNAYYDRASITFFHRELDGRTYYSGASTDVVAHEAGHGFLDTLRPDLWSALTLEPAAFHEAFGDCVAVLTALFDADTRTGVLDALRKKNLCEATAEELSHAIGLIAPGHNAAAPRRALNKFQWAPPNALPTTGGPGALINEVHSFGQVFTGCFYDLILNVLGVDDGTTADDLLAAATVAGRLLVAGTTDAPIRERFFREVGRAMMQSDAADNGRYQDAIRDAFAAHGITLGASMMMAAETSLRGALTKAGALSPALKRDLLGRLDAPARATMSAAPVEIAQHAVTEVSHLRDVDLGKVHRRLRGVVARVPESVLLANTHGVAAVLGPLPNPGSTAVEASAFVSSLVANGQVAFTPLETKSMFASAKNDLPPQITHVVRATGERQELVRIRFTCS